jgi:hypothetical protein
MPASTNLSFSQLKALAADATFQGQVQMSAVREAMAQIGAASTAHSVADHKRWALAQSTLADGCTANLTRFAYAIASTAGFNVTAGTPPTATDADIDSAMVAKWDNIAGITAGDMGS